MREEALLWRRCGVSTGACCCVESRLRFQGDLLSATRVQRGKACTGIVGFPNCSPSLRPIAPGRAVVRVPVGRPLQLLHMI